MMMEEFEARTGFAVTPNEYRAIEKKYADEVFGRCDKDEFCRLWVGRGGIKEILQARKDGNVELPHIKRYTNKELMELIVEKVGKTDDYKKAEAILDYFLPEKFSVVRLTNYEFDFHALADFGGSEGIYLDCWLAGSFDDTDETRCKMGTFKTLRDDLEGMKIMAELGGILNYHLSRFVNQNINSFSPEKELRQFAMHRAAQELDRYLLFEKYQVLLGKGKRGDLTLAESEILLRQIREIEKTLPTAAVQGDSEHEELEQGEEI
jgi:hypothetical protein